MQAHTLITENQMPHVVDTFPAPRRRMAVLIAALSAILPLACSSQALAFPDRPIRMIIPLPPGGAVDIVARLIQPHLEKSLGKPVIIENRAGASGIVGAQAVANAEPDGHTLLLVPTTFTINAAVHDKLPFNPLRSFEPITVAGRNSLMVLVNPKVQAKSLKEFAALAKARPGALNYATPGASSQAHFLLELWSGQADIKMQHIPYRGGAPAVLATVSGEADVTLISPTASLSQIQAGALRALATGGATREAQLPDVPTTAEAGYPDFKALQWVGLLATGGTPKPIVDRLQSEVQRALQLADVKTKLAEQGMTVDGGTPAEFRALIEAEIKQWADVARKANIRVN
jgi:tripartite-type tricarboxylate transporter receptor subunit TctC